LGVSYVNALRLRMGRKYREQQKAVCRRKVPFPTYDACAKWCSRRTYPYECPCCKQWHRTHRKPSVIPAHRQEELAAQVLEMFR